MLADGLAFPDDWAWSEAAQTWVPLKDLLSQKAGADPAAAATQPSAATPLPSGFRPLLPSLRERALQTPARGSSEQTPASAIVKRPNYVHEAAAYQTQSEKSERPNYVHETAAYHTEAEKSGWQVCKHEVLEGSDVEQSAENTTTFWPEIVILATVAAVSLGYEIIGNTGANLFLIVSILIAGLLALRHRRLR